MSAHARGDARRDAILAFIEDYWAQHGAGPLGSEVAAGVGLKSIAGYRYHLEILVESGCVEMRRSKPRTLRVVEP